MNASEIIYGKSHPKPIDNYVDLCYYYWQYLSVRVKSILLQILTARTYKISKIGVDNDDKAADNLPCRAVPCRAVPCRAVPCRQEA